MNRMLSPLLLLLPIAVHAAMPAETPKAAEAPVVLSPYEVRAATVQFQSWIKVGSPHYIIYTDGTAREASQALREFEMVYFATQVVFGRPAANLGPTVVILPTASSDWHKLEAKGGGVEWKAATTATTGFAMDVIVAQYDWENEGLGGIRALMAETNCKRMDIAAPFWFHRGVECFYETAAFEGDKVILGHANSRIMALHNQAWLPWDRFFKVTPQSPEFRKEDKVQVYEGQAAAFTQYLFTNPDHAWTGRLVAWLEYLRSGGAPTEQQFKTIFGQDWKAWQTTMERYLNGGEYSLFEVKVPPQFSHFTETKYNLPVKEMRELFVIAQTLVQSVPDSKTSLDALLAHGLQSEALREVLLESCLEWERYDDALKIVRELIAAGTKNPRVYREGDALLTRYGGPFTLDLRYGPELAEVRAWDRRGLELEPLYTNLNESFAANEANAPVVDQQSIMTIEDCYRRIRGRAPVDKTLMALAVALWRTGDTKTASELAQRLKDDALVSEYYRNMAGELLDRIGANANGGGNSAAEVSDDKSETTKAAKKE
jgi:hypothetical protein